MKTLRAEGRGLGAWRGKGSHWGEQEQQLRETWEGKCRAWGLPGILWTSNGSKEPDLVPISGRCVCTCPHTYVHLYEWSL